MDRDALLDFLPPAWMGVTPKKCARIILKGVKRNKSTIVVSGAARLMWATNRLSTTLWQFMGRLGYKAAIKRLSI